MSPDEIKTTEVAVSREVNAKAEEVFDVWMDQKSTGGPWFGASKVIVNPVVDGLFYLAVEHGGRNWAHYGRFLRIERPRLAEYTWVSQATRGLESVVSVSFREPGERTEVTLRHSGIPEDAMGLQHRDGWTWVLSVLAQPFAAEGEGK